MLCSQVGPPSGVLARTPVDSWTAKQVAETVLADRSTSRVTAGQRVALNSVEDATAEQRDGQTYWVSVRVCIISYVLAVYNHAHHAQNCKLQVYDHISQGSPNLLSPERETYRRAAAVTACREGSNDHMPYLYTLNFACPSETWDDMEPVFRKASPLLTRGLLCITLRGMLRRCLIAVASADLLTSHACAGHLIIQVDVATRRLCGSRSANMAILLNTPYAV